MSPRVIPSTAIRLARLRAPETIVRLRRGQPSASASSAIRASFAAPSTGAAASRTSTASPRLPLIAVRPARGITRTLTSGLALDVFDMVAGPRQRRVRLPRTMQQHLVVRTVLIADELERVVERLDGRLERSFDAPAAQP
jgi:hypothetical protein